MAEIEVRDDPFFHPNSSPDAQISEKVQVKQPVLDIKGMLSQSVKNPLGDMKMEPDKKMQSQPIVAKFDQLEEMSDMMLSDLDEDSLDPIEEAVSQNEDTENNETQKSSEVAFMSKGSLDANFANGVQADSISTFDIQHIGEVEFNRTKSHFVKKPSFDSKNSSFLSQIKDKSLSDMIYKLMRDREALAGKLQVATNELALVNKVSKLSPLDMSDSKLQFTFLFASPLVRDNNGSIESVMQLD